MKKLFNLFLWFCFATVMAQVCIISLSAFRGNINRSSFVELAALLNGIDIQGKSLQTALVNARETPVASYEDIVELRAQKSLEMDTRETALKRYADQLDTLQAKIELDREKLDRRREAFEKKLDELAKGVTEGSLAEVQKILEELPPDQTKAQLLQMLKANQIADVVAIVKGMPQDKRKKILGEFTSAEEATQLYEILTELRKGEPMKSLIDEAYSAAKP